MSFDFPPIPVVIVSLGLIAVSRSTHAVQEQAGLPPRAAASYDSVYAGVVGLAPRADQYARVEGLVIERDVGRFTLESGDLFLLTPVGDRAVAAVFHGTGRFAFTPSTSVEREHLARFFDRESLDEEIEGLFLLFTDTTAAELQARLRFEQGEVTGDARSTVDDALRFLAQTDLRYVEPDVMQTLLNPDANGFFYAHVDRRRGGPLMFTVNPYEVERIRLSREARGRGPKRAEIVSQFRDREHVGVPLPRYERSGDATIRHYGIETWLPQNTLGEIRFSAAARMEITADAPVGPWIAFWLYPELDVDSARWVGGSAAVFAKHEDNPVIWIQLREPLDRGMVDTLDLFYHGDLIERLANFFLIKSSAAWYPRSRDARRLATFDLTFHTPTSYTLASVGALRESREEGNMRTTRWLTLGPIRNASFNLGAFEEFVVEEEDAPPVTVLFSDVGHREIARRLGYSGRARNVRDEVGSDVAKSLKFFSHVFGEVPVDQFYATEILYGHGEAFPGLVHLSASTFESTSRSGDDELFRAHEVAHQWWGIALDFATYHDQWLSEGFSQFAGLWYLQTVRRDNDKYFDMLHRWRDQITESRGSIFARGQEAGPVWLGYRTQSSETPLDYGLIVYEKAAWILHMLRIQLLNLQNMNEDAFTEMLRDFYGTHRGGRASTEDFQRTVERHVGADMQWFFDQWVYGTAIPTYRVSWRAEPAEGGRFRMQIRVRQEDVPEGFRADVPIAVDFGDNRFARLRVPVRELDGVIDLPLMPAEPRGLQFNVLDGVLAEVKMERWRD